LDLHLQILRAGQRKTAKTRCAKGGDISSRKAEYPQKQVIYEGGSAHKKKNDRVGPSTKKPFSRRHLVSRRTYGGGKGGNESVLGAPVNRVTDPVLPSRIRNDVTFKDHPTIVEVTCVVQCVLQVRVQRRFGGGCLFGGW